MKINDVDLHRRRRRCIVTVSARFICLIVGIFSFSHFQVFKFKIIRTWLNVMIWLTLSFFCSISCTIFFLVCSIVGVVGALKWLYCVYFHHYVWVALNGEWSQMNKKFYLCNKNYDSLRRNFTRASMLLLLLLLSIQFVFSTSLWGWSIYLYPISFPIFVVCACFPIEWCSRHRRQPRSLSKHCIPIAPTVNREIMNSANSELTAYNRKHFEWKW